MMDLRIYIRLILSSNSVLLLYKCLSIKLYRVKTRWNKKLAENWTRLIYRMSGPPMGGQGPPMGMNPQHMGMNPQMMPNPQMANQMGHQMPPQMMHQMHPGQVRTNYSFCWNFFSWFSSPWSFWYFSLKLTQLFST